MNRTELRSFCYFQILIKITCRDLSRYPENWLILKFVLIHCKTVKVNQNDKNSIENLISCFFLPEWNRIKKILSFWNLFWNYMDLSSPENWLILKFVFIQCKTVKVSQNDQIQLQTWFPDVFLMNGTEIRSFSHFQILTKITYRDLRRNLGTSLMLKFAFIHCITVKLNQNDKISIINLFSSCFLDE